MAQATKTKLDKTLEKSTVLITNKRSRSVIFLIISFFFILGINSILPLIEGGTQYTAEVRNSPYYEYYNIATNNGTTRIQDTKYKLTWLSAGEVELARIKFKQDNPWSGDELLETRSAYDARVERGLNVPGNVYYYTKYFFESAAWYMMTGVSMFSAVVLFYAFFNYLITRSKDVYKPYVDLVKQLQTIIENLLNPDKFEPWMDNVFNVRRKIAQHKANVKLALDKLERKTDYDTRSMFRTIKLDTLHLYDVGSLRSYSLKERKYIKKKVRLLSMLTDEYIDQNVMGGTVKHFVHVYPMFVYNGSNGLGVTVDSYSLIVSDTSKVSRDAVRKILLSLLIAIVFAALLTFTISNAAGQGAWWLVINIVVKIVPLFLQVPLAIDYSNSFMEEQLIGNLISRRAISYQFLAEMRANGVEKRTEKEVRDIVLETNGEVQEDAKEN